MSRRILDPRQSDIHLKCFDHLVHYVFVACIAQLTLPISFNLSDHYSLLLRGYLTSHLLTIGKDLLRDASM